ncbi:MAG: DUF5668 domain-containing protein [Candidatus Falkowbacteria bacterium]
MPKKILKASSKKATIHDLMPEEPQAFDDWQTPDIHNHYYQVNRKRADFGKIAFAVTLIMLGFIYLGVNLGWLPPEVKPDLWQMWPLLLIFLGLSMITGQGLLSILAGSALTLTVLTMILLLLFNNLPKTIATNLISPDVSLSTNNQSPTIPLAIDKNYQAQSTQANITVNSTQLEITSSSNSTQLVYGNLKNGNSSFCGNSNLVGKKQIIDINLPAPQVNGLTAAQLSLNLSPDLDQLDLLAVDSTTTVNTLALPANGPANLQLEGGQITLDLANTANLKDVHITGNACQMTINVPPNHGLKLIGKSTLTDNSQKLVASASDTMVTDHYENAAFQTTLNLKLTDCPITVNQQ